MLQALIAGLVIGGVYAIASSGLVVTYVSTGILNFAFGAMAFTVARFYYYLVAQHGWAILPAALLSILGLAPALGIALYFCLFRYLRQSPTVIKIVSTVGLSVALPALAILLFGNQPINVVPGLAKLPVHVYLVDGVAITTEDVICFAIVALVLVVGTLILRFTDIGLDVRALVDSEALTSLSAVKPGRVLMGVWGTSGLLAGLAGVLAAPVIGLTSEDFGLLLAGALAAVLVARLRSLPVAAVVGLVMGMVGSVVTNYLPASSSYTAGVIPSIPFAFVILALIYFIARSGTVDESTGRGGALDRAIAVESKVKQALARRSALAGDSSVARLLPGGLTPLIIVAILPLVLHGAWISLVGAGLAYAVCFLSYTLITGEGGMIWLCQISFAGLGAVTTGQILVHTHLPVLVAVLIGGVAALLVGAIVGALTIRLGDLYVSLATLALGLLLDNLVFTQPSFVDFGAGVTVNPPNFATGDRALDYLLLVIFALVALFVSNFRRSTSGVALNAVRRSRKGSSTLGISAVQMKVVAAACGALIAGIGGGALAMSSGVALPSSFATLGGLVWLAVLVTAGVRSNTAALLAGLSFSLIPGIFLNYLPTSLDQIPTILFGLGAVLVAINPDGVVAENVRQLAALTGALRRLVVRAGGARFVSRLASVPREEGAPAVRAAALSPSAERRRPPLVVGLGAARRDASSERPPIIQAEDVRVHFGGVAALQGVSLAVPHGATVGLVGPNGAGKTTLFDVLSGLRRADSGVIRLSGKEITGASPQTVARLGVARTFQQPELFRGLTIREHLLLADRVHRSPRRLLRDGFNGGGFRGPSREETERMEALLDMLGLQGVGDVDVSSLPLGTSRLVEIGRCLAREPSLILLDESFSGLDSLETERSAALLQRVGERGVSVLLIEHDVELVLSLCSTVAVLDFGQMIATGTPREIRSDPRVQAAYLGEDPHVASGQVS
jgi:branched-chain amino acid transport system permease protein